MSNKLNYGSFTETIIEKTPRFNFRDIHYKEYSNSNLKQVTVLEFWNSRCGPCYKQFPIIDSIYKQKNIKYDLFVVNVPLHGESFIYNKKILNRFSYSFPQLFATNIKILEDFKIKSFPTTLILKNQHIIFRGDFQNAIKYLKSSEKF